MKIIYLKQRQKSPTTTIEEEPSTNLDYLPAELVDHIGSFLPTKNLSHFSAVCAFFRESLQPRMKKRKLAVSQIAIGNRHLVLLRGDGTVWGCGDNTFGQLGLSQQTNFSTFSRIPGLPKIKQVLAGHGKTFFLTEGGAVWGCGINTLGQLGLGHQEKQLTPAKIPHLENIKQIMAEDTHTLFLDQDGAVWGCGDNSSQQLGMGHKSNQLTPIKIPGLVGIRQIIKSTGGWLFLCKDGTVTGYGFNYQGALGLGHQDKQSTPTRIPGLTNVKQIVTGKGHTIFLCVDDTIWGCGNNSLGQLGLDGKIALHSKQLSQLSYSQIAQVAAGFNHTVFLGKDGTVWSCGDNSKGQLGLGKEIKAVPYPIQIPRLCGIKQIVVAGNSTFFLGKNGKVWSCGDNSKGQLGLGKREYITQPTQLPELIDIKQIAVSANGYTFFVKEDETLWACGGNGYGQLGMKSCESALTPTQIKLSFAEELPDIRVSSALGPQRQLID